MAWSANDSLGAQNPKAVIKYLREIGDDDAADKLHAKGGTGQGLSMPWQDQVYGYTGLLIGYIPSAPSDGTAAITNAVVLPPDPALKNSRVKITIERLYVHCYPGRGQHEILCEFTGKNQADGEQEEMQFALTTKANDGGTASINGAPIFLGVTVGNNGIAFEGRTINVGSKGDEDFLAALSGGSFRDGLNLLTTVQPALKPFVGLASSVVSAVLKRSKNRQIHSFNLGFDFSDSPTSVALRHGSFAIIQTDENDWDWSRLAWNVGSQRIVQKDTGAAIPFNYLILKISPFED
ncbi:hypothetical protein ACVIGA_000228 [Bradyrhizobium sp. USDA 3240]